MSASDIPLGEIFVAANSLRLAGLIEEYSLGGALAAIRYTEPFATYAADIFFIPADKSLTAGVPSVYTHLRDRGCPIDREHIVIRGFPVQWLAAHGLTEEAVLESVPIEFDGELGHVFRVEYIVAIAASVGRTKDRVRIEQILEQAELDRSLLNEILTRHHLSIPKS